MSAKLKKHRRAMFVSGVYMLICLAFLISMTTSKYVGGQLAYTSFGAADFNALVLQPTDAQQEQDTSLLATIAGQRFRPGMTIGDANNPAVSLGFVVSNYDPLAASVPESEVALLYTVRLRTANILPLDFTLEGEDGAHYEAGIPTPVQVQVEGSSQVQQLYEYSFYETTGQGVTQESVFRLEGTAADRQVMQLHRLYIEWPTEVESDSQTNFMKEVELMEIIVNATSLNYLEEPGYIPDSSDFTDQYSRGLVLLLPPDESGSPVSKEYTYKIDYRAFYGFALTGDESSTQWVGKYRLMLDNAVNYTTVDELWETTDCTLELKVPVDMLVTEGREQVRVPTEASYSAVIDQNEETEQTFELTGYRLYNKKTGQYGTYTQENEYEYGTSYTYSQSQYHAYRDGYDQMTEGHKDADAHGWYAIYTLSGVQLTNVKKDTYSENYFIEADSSTVELRLTLPGLADDGVTAVTAQEVQSYLKQLAYQERIEVTVTATFSGNKHAASGNAG